MKSSPIITNVVMRWKYNVTSYTVKNHKEKIGHDMIFKNMKYMYLLSCSYVLCGVAHAHPWFLKEMMWKWRPNVMNKILVCL